MRAVAIDETADGTRLKIIDAEVPTPGSGQILIKVHAAGLNRADLRRSQHHFKVAGPIIAGLEAAGEVIAVGSEVVDFQPGERVVAMAPGGYAEFCVADDVSAARLPDGIDMATGAGLFIWYQTAHDALVTAGRIEPGARVLITAAKSGVGLATAQCARLLGASTVIGSVRTPTDDPDFLALQWDAIVAGDPDAIRKGVMEATDGNGVDIVIDMVGGGLLDALIDATALGGRIVSVGRMAGIYDQLDMNKLALRRISLVGVTFRTRNLEDKRAARDALVKDLWAPIADGRLVPLMDRTFPLEQADEAQEYMASNQHLGKIVLTTP